MALFLPAQVCIRQLNQAQCLCVPFHTVFVLVRIYNSKLDTRHPVLHCITSAISQGNRCEVVAVLSGRQCGKSYDAVKWFRLFHLQPIQAGCCQRISKFIPYLKQKPYILHTFLRIKVYSTLTGSVRSRLSTEETASLTVCSRRLSRLNQLSRLKSE